VDEVLDDVDGGGGKVNAREQGEKELVIEGVESFTKVKEKEVVILIILHCGVKIIVHLEDIIEDISVVEESLLTSGDDAFNRRINALACDSTEETHVGVAHIDGTGVGDKVGISLGDEMKRTVVGSFGGKVTRGSIMVDAV
jgi:hypothetical protein